MEITKTKNGEFRYKEKVRLPSGKLITKTFTRKTDALIWKRKVETEKSQGLLGILNFKSIAFKELADKWFALKITHVHARRTSETYLSTVKAHIIPNLKDLQVGQVTLSHIEKMKGELLTRGLKAKTINRALSITRQILLYGVDEGYLRETPIKRSLMVKSEKPKIQYFEDSEIRSLLRANQDYDIYPILYLALHTGMRRGEIFGLCWDRVNFNSRRIEITRTLHARKILQDKTKGGRARYFPLNPELRAFFLELKRTQKNPRFVFTDDQGGAIDPNHYSGRNFSAACKRANVRQLRFHDLRHSYASAFAMAGGNIFELKELLGHRDLQTTMVYAHLSPNHLEKASRIVNFGDAHTQSEATGPLVALVKPYI